MSGRLPSASHTALQNAWTSAASGSTIGVYVRIVRLGANVQRSIVRFEPRCTAGAVARDKRPPGAPLLRFDAARLPHVSPVPLGTGDLGLGRQRFEGINQAVVGIDANPELRFRDAVLHGRAKPSLDAEREQ